MSSETQSPTDMHSTVGVVGGGRWGIALAHAAVRAGHKALLCTRRDDLSIPPGVELTPEMRVLAERCTLILLATPSDVVRSVARQLGDVIDGSHLVVHGVRGLSGEGLTTISAVIREETPCRRVGALGGPAMADDLIAGRPGLIAVASHYPEVTLAVQKRLGSPMLRVYTTPDLIGLEWASALNGALFVALGYARAIGATPALIAGFLTRGVHEAALVATAVEADERTFMGLAGFGDVMAAMSQDDRPEVKLGAALAEGASIDRAREIAGQRVEAPALIPRIVAFAKERKIAVPIFTALAGVIAGHLTRDEALHSLMMSRSERGA